MKKLTFIIISVLCTLCVYSQNIIRPKIAGPNGLWVNSYNGVLFFGRTDCETRNSAMPMQLRFYYNSSANETDYGFGLGFSMGYEMRYSVDGDGNVTIETGDGRSDTFNKFGNDYEAPAGVFSVLTQPEEGKYLLTEKTGEKYYFDNPFHMKVTGIEDRYENKTILTYQGGLLVQIKDAADHTINLQYADGLLTKAEATFINGCFTYEYDSHRRLRKIINPLGHSTLYAYNKDNRLEEITDAEGHKTNIAYNHANMVSRLKTEVTDKSIRYDGDKTVFIDYTGTQNQYSYYRWDDRGRVIEKVGLCCGVQSSLEYDNDDNVIRMIDGNGHATSYTYDDRGNMLSLTDASGNTQRYTYDPIFNQITSFTDKNGNTYRFNYDGKGSLISLSGPLGFSQNNTYDSHGWLLTTTDPNGNVTTYSYNLDGTTSKIVDAAGYATIYSYDSTGSLISVTDALGHTTSYDYDALGQIKSQTDALGGKTSVSYDKVGNIVRVKDALNYITAYTYDAVGNVLTKTDAMGNVFSMAYDGKGNVISVKNPLDQIQIMTYNERNKLKSVTNPAGEITSYEYDVKGNLTSVNLPNGNSIGYWYDELDRIIFIDDNLGTIAEYTYDANGNQLTLTDGMKRTVSYAYDALNRKVSETIPSGAKTTYEYDNNSNLMSVTDALGHKTQFAYSSLNQQLAHIDALNAKTTFEYDAVGNLIKVTDANGNPTTWTYDALNRNTYITFADGLARQYSYDAVGNMISSLDRAGNKFTYLYNPNGYLLTKDYPDKTQDTFTYDALGHMLSAINKDATVTFAYDESGRLIEENLNGRITSYAYDVAGGKRILFYPSGIKVEENLNVRNLITSIIQNDTEVVSIEYNKAGQKTNITYANGVNTGYLYNENGWLTGINDNHEIVNFEMSYDDLGNIIERRDLSNSGNNESYGYDIISQLTSFQRGATVNNYEYDLLGNRLKCIENGELSLFTSNKINSYTAITGKLNFSPRYDNNGNMLNDYNHIFGYDYNNKLSSIDEMTQYRYDALGRCICKNNTNYYYAGDFIIEEINDQSSASAYLYGGEIDDVLLITKQSSNYYYHKNNIGSIVRISNDTGSMIERVEYDGYGAPYFYDENNNEMERSIIDNSILYTGRPYDYETGTYYYRARTLSPSIGRFLQKDPLMYLDGMDDYSYVGNNPISFIDFSGTFRWWSLLKAFGGIAEIIGGVGIVGMSGGLATVGGVLVIAHGVDNYQSAIRELWCDSDIETGWHWLLRKVGWSDKAADRIEFGTNLYTGVLSGLGSSAAIADSRSAIDGILHPKSPNYIWPKDNWFVKDGGIRLFTRQETLKPGTIVSRIGGESGSFLSPAGTPIEMRALMPGNKGINNLYEVVREVPVESSRVLPWFGRLGLGKQYKLPNPVSNYTNPNYQYLRKL